MKDRAYRLALGKIWARSGYDRGFISNPFAGDDAARLGLRRTQALLGQLGDPDRSLRLVHVAGSKGKGSTTVLLDAMFRAAELRSGRFTSPHLHSYRERFVVDDEPIDQDSFAELVAEVIDAAIAAESAHPEMGEITAWEISTAMGLLWFARNSCDVAVIEVGLGGTLDATNVLDPEISVISRLDFEHIEILGNSMREIAGNKAGIIKPGRPVVVVEQPEEAIDVICQRARATGSDLWLQPETWQVTGDEHAFTVRGPWGSTPDLQTSLVGGHQIENAGLAVAAIKRGFAHEVSDEAIRVGLTAARHPGRFERVGDVILDGAHTPVATEALAQALRTHYPNETFSCVIGMLSDKSPELVLAPLTNVVHQWFLAEPHSPRRMSIDRLREVVDGEGFDSVDEAIYAARRSGSRVLVTGSLSTVAEARVHLGLAVPDPEPILPDS